MFVVIDRHVTLRFVSTIGRDRCERLWTVHRLMRHTRKVSFAFIKEHHFWLISVKTEVSLVA
jgi:hypothetical protein